MDKDLNGFEEGKQAVRDIKDTLKAGGADVAAEGRAAADAVRSAAGDAADAARVAGAQLGRHAHAAGLAAGVALGDAAETAADAAGDAVGAHVSWLEEQYAHAEEYVRTNPVAAIGAAAGAGLLIGLLLRSRRR